MNTFLVVRRSKTARKGVKWVPPELEKFPVRSRIGEILLNDLSTFLSHLIAKTMMEPGSPEVMEESRSPLETDTILCIILQGTRWCLFCRVYFCIRV